LSRYRPRFRPPPAATPEEIDARLDLFFEELLELTRPGQDLEDLEQAVADAYARVEEWTASPVPRRGGYSST
jgi:hypothetical protein